MSSVLEQTHVLATLLKSPSPSSSTSWLLLAKQAIKQFKLCPVKMSRHLSDRYGPAAIYVTHEREGVFIFFNFFPSPPLLYVRVYKLISHVSHVGGTRDPIAILNEWMRWSLEYKRHGITQHIFCSSPFFSLFFHFFFLIYLYLYSLKGNAYEQKLNTTSYIIKSNIIPIYKSRWP